ncbi:protein ABSCISIC ACID-INSENSITIVE 5-like [Impatiens glandulifera]|uniref:protein ABSCISIC ACID-INSENSITIVE 5-like n=1 Tax=Impatiens glandulifera TaxID=253017 RepID=UPI001FB155FE|nr:protein ABSCISIC ACID-INSENSITIVE 5-like [Impatiens glandulifera]
MDNDLDDVVTEIGMEPTLTKNISRHVIPSPLGRQSSVYSLTIDEFQQAVCESGKNFGSMNMDEFINSIWSAEEQAQSHPAPAAGGGGGLHPQVMIGDGSSSSDKPSVPKQGTITIPTPLCRKTVEEVWSEIQKTHQGDSHIKNSSSAEKQLTFGEMTLEGFLIKAGVVREQYQPSSQLIQDPLLNWYQNNNSSSVMGTCPTPTYVSKPTASTIVGIANIPTYENLQRGNGKNGGVGGYPAVVTAPVYNTSGLGIVSPVPVPVSPVSSDGMYGNESNQYGMEIGVLRGGQKRNMDRPGERVVERRQRRMIKNRESAARSRARKQAYTVELEAELNILKEENTQLKQALVGLKNMVI